MGGENKEEEDDEEEELWLTKIDNAYHQNLIRQATIPVVKALT